MGRNAKASSSRLPTQSAKQAKMPTKLPVAREPESESEVEAESASDDEEVDEDDLLDEEPEEEGIAQYAPDDWDGEDDEASGDASGSGSGSEGEEADSASESEDEGKEDMVSYLYPSILPADLQRKLQENLRSMPLQTLMKAQRSLKQEDSEGGEAGPNSVKAKRLAEAKKQLAEMQRRKGKATAVPLPDLSEDGSEDEFEDLRRSKGRDGEERVRKEKVKRDNKHA
jgi:hypothetical protein